MKKKFSLNALLHNDRLMMLLSLAIAIAVWGLVSFGPGNVQTRTFTASVKIDLTDTSVGYNDLRVIGNDTFTVNVQVEGARSVIYSLTGEDIEIRPSLTDIQGPGKSEVSLTVNKTGRYTDYTIHSISPSSVTVDCDYWATATLPVATDLKALKVEDEKVQQIGDVILESTVTDGRVTLEGPRTVMQNVAAVVARVEKEQTISKTTHFDAKLLALDKNGAEVDISQCVFTGIADNMVDVTVPVWVQRKVDLTYTLANVPSGISQNGLVKLSNKSITLVGEAETLDAIAATVGDLGTFDFDHIKPEEAERTINLNIPAGVRVLEGNAVYVTFSTDTLATRTISLDVNSVSDVTVENLPEGKTITLQAQKLTDIVLCGAQGTLRRITAKDLKVTLDASGNTAGGSVRYAVRITLPKYPAVWVYYGADDAAAYQLYGTLE